MGQIKQHLCKYVGYVGFITASSTPTSSSTRQRPFDLWLILRAWPHTPQVSLETSSQAGHVLLESDTAKKTDHNTGNSGPYSFRTVLGSFTSRRIVNNEELRDGTYALSSCVVILHGIAASTTITELVHKYISLTMTIFAGFKPKLSANSGY